MNRKFYHSLMLTHAFFRTFQHIRYRGVPVARAMFYSFHRQSMRWGGGGSPKKNWPRHKRKLYAQLVNSDPVKKVPYRRKSTGKIIFTPEAASGITHKPGKSIICGITPADRGKYSSRGTSFVIPHRTALNGRAYKLIYQAFVKRSKQKGVSSYFKQRRFLRWVYAELRGAMKTINGCYSLFQHHSIKGVVVHSSVHTLGYVLTHMAKQRKIPTITLQYGLNDDYQLMSTYASRYVSWGLFHKKRLTQFGVPSSKFINLGAARFDPIFRGKWKSKSLLARALKIPKNKWIFLYPEQPLKNNINRKALLTIIRAMHPYRKKVILLVIPHPKQKSTTLPSRTLRKYRFVKILKRNRMHLYHLISGSNAVFVQFSTVGVETILMNKPLISIVLFPNTVKHEFSYYAASRNITSARNQIQLKRIVNKFISSERYRKRLSRKQQVYRMNTYAGTLSAHRIKRYIYQVCR